MGDFWGLTADGWIAIATLCSAAAILVGGIAVFLQVRVTGNQFLREQEARDLRAYVLDAGLRKLAGRLDFLLEALRLNYTLAHHLIRQVRDVPPGRPGAPRSEDLPRLVSLADQSVGFEAIRPSVALLEGPELSKLATHAFGVLYNANLILQTEVEQPIRSFYSGTSRLEDNQRDEFVRRTRELVEREFEKSRPFDKLPTFLEMAGVRFLEMGISRWDDLERYRADLTTRGIKANLNELLESFEASTRD